jgi:hypothetical protein
MVDKQPEAYHPLMRYTMEESRATDKQIRELTDFIETERKVMEHHIRTGHDVSITIDRFLIKIAGYVNSKVTDPTLKAAVITLLNVMGRHKFILSIDPVYNEDDTPFIV